MAGDDATDERKVQIVRERRASSWSTMCKGSSSWLPESAKRRAVSMPRRISPGDDVPQGLRVAGSRICEKRTPLEGDRRVLRRDPPPGKWNRGNAGKEKSRAAPIRQI